MAQHGAIKEEFAGPAREKTDEGSERGMSEEFAVGGCGMGGIEEGVCGCFWCSADALVGERVGARIEDTSAGRVGGVEHVGLNELREVAGECGKS